MTNANPAPATNRSAIVASLTEMVDELTDAEALELEDFIVNHCENDGFIDEDGNYPNLFRIFVTGHRPD